MKYLSLLLISIFIVSAGCCRASTYHLSPTGSDSHTGTMASPWLTPNHNINCGDEILASPSDAYQYQNFYQTFGYVNCAINNNVAWLKCATFDGCKINVGKGAIQAWGMLITQPYWGVQGWEVTNLTSNGHETAPCFDTSAHHTIWANNIANQCGGAGIGCSADYCVAVGNIVYAAAQFSADCHSGIDVFIPRPVDSLPGTHIYVAGNFVWSTTNPSFYSSGAYCYDGNGIISDTLVGQNCTPVFTGKLLFENNITVSNGGVGVRVEYSGPTDYGTQDHQMTCTPVPNTFPIQIVRNNTSWGNGGPGYGYGIGSQNGGQLQIQSATNVTYTGNIAESTFDYLFGADASYDVSMGYALNSAFQVANGDSGDSVTGNWLYSDYNNPLLITDVQGIQTTTSTFAYGSNITTVQPQFANPTTPGSPNCASTGGSVSCMQQFIANFKPTAAAAAYGYRPPSSTPAYDKDFPEWLCHVGAMPEGLITLGCRASSAVIGGIM